MYDNGIHCPERCGLCERSFANPETSTTVQVQVSVDQPIHEFQPTPFRQAFADSLAISVNSIRLVLSAGSTVVDMQISTVGGTPEEASTLHSRVGSVFASPSAASSVMGVPGLVCTEGAEGASPVAGVVEGGLETDVWAGEVVLDSPRDTGLR